MRCRLTVPTNGNPAVIRSKAPLSTTFHLFVGEKMKKDDAGGIGNVCVFCFISDMRRGLAPTPLPVSTSSPSVISHTTLITIISR